MFLIGGSFLDQEDCQSCSKRVFKRHLCFLTFDEWHKLAPVVEVPSAVTEVNEITNSIALLLGIRLHAYDISIILVQSVPIQSVILGINDLVLLIA